MFVESLFFYVSFVTSVYDLEELIVPKNEECRKFVVMIANEGWELTNFCLLSTD